MSDSVLGLNKYSIMMMTVIFKGFAANATMAWLSTSMAMVELATFSMVKCKFKKITHVWAADMCGNILLIRLCTVQPFSNYLVTL